MSQSYHAELLISNQKQALYLGNQNGTEYAEFNLKSSVRAAEHEQMMYTGYQQSISQNQKHYLLDYVPEDMTRSAWKSQEVHLAFMDKSLEYFVRLVPKEKGTRIREVQYCPDSYAKFEEIFTPQPNLNDKRAFRSDQSFRVSAKQTGDQHGDGGQWQFTPPPLILGLRLTADSQQWLMIGLAVSPGHYNFNSLDYRANSEGRFCFALDFGGHEMAGVDGWESPHLLMSFSDDPYQGVEEYRQSLVRKKLVPEPHGRRRMQRIHTA